MTNTTPSKPSSIHCSFCGKGNEEVKKIIAGPKGAICDECVELSASICKEELTQTRMRAMADIPTPRQIYDYLGQYVIGQETARRVIAVAVHNHYTQEAATGAFADVEFEKSNILMIGPTGCGKTQIARALAKLLDVPFTIADATSLTEAGYVGDDVESILSKLYQAADCDVERTQRGIIFIDEIDKIARRGDSASITRDVSGEGVQQALLKMIEGTVASINPAGGRKNPEQSLVQIDTSRILFIGSGAFAGLDKIVSARSDNKSIGFGASVEHEGKRKTGELLAAAEPEDLYKFGLIPELVGRLPVFATLQDLDEEALMRILTEPKNAIIRQFQELFRFKGVTLAFSEDGLRDIARRAIQRKTGARGLRSIVVKMLNDTMFDLPELAAGIDTIEIAGTNPDGSLDVRHVPRPDNDADPIGTAA